MPDVADLSAPLPQRLLWRGDDLPANAGTIALPAAVERNSIGSSQPSIAIPCRSCCCVRTILRSTCRARSFAT